MTQTAEQTEPRFLQAPKACGNDLEQVEWVGTVAVRITDDVSLGIRFDDADVQHVVSEMFGDRVDTTVESPRAYYSVRLGTPGRRKKAPMNYLYLGGRAVLGTRDLTRLVRGVAHHVSAHVPVGRDGYAVDAVPVQTPRGLMLVPQEILSMAGVVDRVLLPAGFQFADVPRATLQPAESRLVVPDPVVDTAAAEAAVMSRGPAGTEATLSPGRYPLVSWLLSVGAPSIGPQRPASALFHATRLLEPPYPAGAQEALADMGSLVSAVPVTGVTWSTPEELVDQVLEAGRA